MMKIKKN